MKICRQEGWRSRQIKQNKNKNSNSRDISQIQNSIISSAFKTINSFTKFDWNSFVFLYLLHILDWLFWSGHWIFFLPSFSIFLDTCVIDVVILIIIREEMMEIAGTLSNTITSVKSGNFCEIIHPKKRFRV